MGVFAIGLNFPGVENSNLLKTQGIITCSTVGGIPLQLLCVHLSHIHRELLKTNESTQEILHSHYDDLRAKVKDIEQQREVAIRDFEGLDKSFADLHQRYLRLKQSSDSQQQVYTASIHTHTHTHSLYTLPLFLSKRRPLRARWPSWKSHAYTQRRN